MIELRKFVMLANPSRFVILSFAQNLRRCLSFLFVLSFLCPAARAQQPTGQAIYNLTQQFLNVAPKRFNGSPGHLAAEEFITDHFKPEAAKGDLITDEFIANTPAGPQTMRNYIVRFPGKKDGIIVLASHYETNYPLRNINFVGANDGGSTTGLLLAIGDRLREQAAQSPGKKLIGYSVWLLFDDGEESFSPDWIDSDALFGTRHLAAKWARDGTLSQIKAFILADMIGDKDLDIQHEANAAPWLFSLVQQAVKKFGYEKYFFKLTESVDDDHMPFVQRGVPTIDIIDLDYGPNNAYHHTAQDSMDKISARSLTIDGDVFLETIRLIDQRD